MGAVTMSVRELGKYLRSLRPDNKPTLRDIAGRTGLSESFVGKLERGEYDTLLLETMRQVAKGYVVTLEKLLAVSGYVNWQEPPLPDLQVYLRTKYGLTEEGVREAERFIEFVQERHGKAKRK
jgi:transcriptional regulator with XRE-family HTH domain